MTPQEEILALISIISNNFQRERGKSLQNSAFLDQEVMRYRDLMSELGLDRDDVSAEELVNFLRILVAYFRIIDQMYSEDVLTAADHINSILIGNELSFAVIAAFCPMILEVPGSFWGDVR